MRSDLLCRVWIGESWLRSQFVCINITLPPPYPCTLWKVMLAQNVRFFASKSLLQIQLVESESDIDTKSLLSFCIKITPSNSVGRKWKWHRHKESSVFFNQNYSSSSQSLSSTPSMQSWNLVFCDLSNNALQCIVTHDSWGFCQKNYLFKRLCGEKNDIGHTFPWCQRKSEAPDVTCSREWVVPRILLTESFSPFPMLSASSLFKVMRAE